MKKTILLLTFVLASFYGFAQDALYGVRAGYNISNLDFDPSVPAGVENAHRNGFAIGFFGEYSLTDSFSFAPEVQFSAEGAKDQELRINYIQVPLLLKVYLVKGLSVEAGPQFGFKIHEEFDSEPNSDGGDFEIDEDDSYVKDFDTSLAIGTSYKFDSGFFLSARYTMGLTNIFKEDTLFENVDGKNEVLQVGLGFMF